MSNTPAIGGTAPIPVEVKAGETYWWCTCGRSATQPFCDGSHQAENRFEPLAYTPERDGRVFFCTCKRTTRSPLCDGSHKAVAG